ncbi:MAG: hypothetical protein ACP5P4_00730 [Steroidobacteraceae bacterium]
MRALPHHRHHHFCLRNGCVPAGHTKVRVRGEPLVLLGGELAHSSAGTATAEAPTLPAPRERAGENPSGGPDRLMQPIDRADAPDVRWLHFEHWVNRYRRAGNPIFVPESRRSVAAFDALCVFGQARGFGFSAFAVDQPSVHGDRPQRALADVHEALRNRSGALLRAQRADRTGAPMPHLDSPQPEQTLALGGDFFRATFARDRKSGRPLPHTGAMLFIERRAGDFNLLGLGLAVTVLRDLDVDTGIASISQVDRLVGRAGRGRVVQRLNAIGPTRGGRFCSRRTTSSCTWYAITALRGTEHRRLPHGFAHPCADGCAGGRAPLTRPR